jgi:UDP-GlcNAc3NAcA epimerase
MLEGIEEICLKEKPDCLLVYGDTNSTVAGGLCASKLRIPLIHVEAGVRSFNKSMPEEINRIMCDHVSTLLFTPTSTGLDNLKSEGFNVEAKKPYSIDNPRVHHCGDVMYDNSLYFSSVSDEKSNLIEELGLTSGEFILSTIHRDNNTDVPERLAGIFKAMLEIAEDLPIILPLHPRTKKLLPENLSAELFSQIDNSKNIRIIDPVGFLDIIALEKHSKMIVTDSGGLQKEAFFFQKPCLILRPETEWVEIVENGNAIIADADYDKIINGYRLLKSKTDLTYPTLYGDGKAGHFICQEVLNLLNEK